MSGYSLTDADRERVHPTNLCTKCTNLLREPTQTINCGHRYCKACIESILSQEVSVCVADGIAVTRETVFPDKFVHREILSLVLQCINSDKGCQWKGELKHREEHATTCDFGEVPCVIPECALLIQRSELANHLQNKCEYRQEACSFCQEMIVVATMTEHQQKTCPKYPETCPECGKTDILRCELSLHLDPTAANCEQVKAVCPFKQIGCKTAEVMGLKDRMEHAREEVIAHLHLLLKEVEKLPKMDVTGYLPGNELALASMATRVQQGMQQISVVLEDLRALSYRVDANESRITELKASRNRQRAAKPAAKEIADNEVEEKKTLSEVLRRVHNQEATSADLELFLAEGHTRDDALQEQVTALKNEQERLRNALSRVERQKEYTEQALGLRNMALGDLEDYVRSQESTTFDGNFIWKVTDFSRRKMDALTGKQKSFYSPTFRTGRYGYKLCARLYLNGDGMGEGTHISLFFVVMRGEYDALLRWPFRQKVTLMLLDQNHGEHVIDNFLPNPDSSSFQRPRMDKNVASGCPLFCPLSNLDKHAYVRQDTMFFKIIVDLSGI